MQVFFTGDTSFTGVYDTKVREGKNIFSANLISLFKKQDYIVCNFEGAATNEKNILRKDIKVVSPVGSVKYLVNHNFTVFNLANNHTFDCGLEGFLDTKAEIIRESSCYFGAGETLDEASRVVYLQKGGITVALIGICHSEGLLASKCNPGIFCDTNIETIKKQIRVARENADWVILNYHGGEEYTTIPMPRRRKLFHKLIKLDIDLLIAHHPHVLQGFEKVGRKTIFYSLGNFVFDIETHRQKELTNQSALLKIKFNKNKYDFEFIPISIDIPNGRVCEADKSFLLHIRTISDFKSYRLKWLKDANRTLLQPNIKKIQYNCEDNMPKPTNKSFKKKLLLNLCKPMFYKNIYKIIRSPNLRPIFLGATQYKFLQILKVMR